MAACAVVLSLQATAKAQIFLSPNQQYPQRPRGSLDLGGGVRCQFERGAGPSLSISVGAYPDTLFNDVVIRSGSSSVASQSSMFGLISLNIPLRQKEDNFSCDDLMQDVKLRTRLQSLRELVDENIITEPQYKKAVIEAYKTFFEKASTSGMISAPPASDPGAQVVMPADNKTTTN